MFWDENRKSLAGTYEAFAHIIVGLLIGGIWLCKETRLDAAVFLAAATILEIVMFLMR